MAGIWLADRMNLLEMTRVLSISDMNDNRDISPEISMETSYEMDKPVSRGVAGEDKSLSGPLTQPMPMTERKLLKIIGPWGKDA